MATRRISSKEAKRIPGARVVYFNDSNNAPRGRVFVPKGMYYAIVADSPERGVVVSRRHYTGFERATTNYAIGRAGGDSGSIVCFVEA